MCSFELMARNEHTTLCIRSLLFLDTQQRERFRSWKARARALERQGGRAVGRELSDQRRGPAAAPRRPRSPGPLRASCPAQCGAAEGEPGGRRGGRGRGRQRGPARVRHPAGAAAQQERRAGRAQLAVGAGRAVRAAGRRRARADHRRAPPQALPPRRRRPALQDLQGAQQIQPLLARPNVTRIAPGAPLFSIPAAPRSATPRFHWERRRRPATDDPRQAPSRPPDPGPVPTLTRPKITEYIAPNAFATDGSPGAPSARLHSERRAPAGRRFPPPATEARPSLFQRCRYCSGSVRFDLETILFVRMGTFVCVVSGIDENFNDFQIILYYIK